MTYRHLIWLVLAVPALASAQKCPQGLAGAPGCVAPPSHPDSPLRPRMAPQGPTERWISQWGAVYIDRKAKRLGVSTFQDSKRLAKKAAKASCLANQGVDCEPMAVYANACIVYMGSENFSAWAVQPTSMLARRMVEDGCRQRGVVCEVVYEACSLPQQIR